MAIPLHKKPSARQPLADVASDPYVAFARSTYDVATALARRLPTHESRLLLARVALRERRPDEAVELLVRWRGQPEPALDAERNLLLATAYERLGRHDEAGALYELPLPRNATRALRNEWLYVRALGCWIRGEQDDAEGLISRQEPDRHTAFAQGRDLLGWIEVGRREYLAAAQRFEEALDVFDQAALADEGARAICVHSLSIVAVETLDLRFRERIRSEYLRMPATPWVKKQAFHTGQYLVRLEALCGADASAFTLASELQTRAERHDEKLRSHVTIAEFLRVRGDKAGPRFHLELAKAELRSERWSKSDADDAMAALLYCIEASYVDPRAAAEGLTRVLSASGKSDLLLAFEHDARANALALYARGRVAVALGDAPQGEELIRRALAIWTQYLYRYRIAIAELDLASMFEDTASLARAKEIVSEVPASWLGEYERKIENRLHSGLADLSRAERRVLRYLCEGKSNREIAESLQRSESTIRNQTQRIFDVLGINSRAALVARCAEWAL
ncbi:MAG TPA: LuxR C-terminal-related transcriptional regulator [Candidatus Acidoferrum sp.]|nr:LuxR C-terminal-related transcriptional regulator [Candidatus Acidoferrum sp.]